jgi:hypothetical protein
MGIFMAHDLFVHHFGCRSLCRVKPLVKGITKIGPAFGYRLVRPYFGNAFNLGLYLTLKKCIRNNKVT